MIPKAACAISVSLSFFTTHASASDVVDFAASLIGRPYVWGAEGPSSFDCSGLTHYVYREFGIDLPRRAVHQSEVGEPSGRRLMRGDLVFFSADTRQSLVTHVGIYEGDGMMIDASKRHGRVRRDNLDEPYWVDRFMFARRLTETATWNDEDAGTRGEPSRGPGGRANDRRRQTARVLGRLAEILLRRPGR